MKPQPDTTFDASDGDGINIRFGAAHEKRPKSLPAGTAAVLHDLASEYGRELANAPADETEEARLARLDQFFGNGGTK